MLSFADEAPSLLSPFAVEDVVGAEGAPFVTGADEGIVEGSRSCQSTMMRRAMPLENLKFSTSGSAPIKKFGFRDQLTEMMTEECNPV